METYGKSADVSKLLIFYIGGKLLFTMIEKNHS
jgi:hypothetical protein